MIGLHVFIKAEDVTEVEYYPQSPTNVKPKLFVRSSEGSVTLFIDADALDRILELGKADQQRQDAATGRTA